MSGVSDSIIVVVARTISGLSGYVVLAVAANSLTAAQFAELALFQTVVFLLQISFDTGLVHLANRETAGSADWRALVDRFQGIRYTTHLAMSLLLVLLVVFGIIRSQDAWLPAACGIALISNSLNLDWILFCRQEQRIWAKKVIIIGITNVASAAALLTLFRQPSAVLAGVSIMNISGWLYLYKKRLTGLPRLTFPTASEARVSAQLSFGAMLVHSGYNAPLLVATSWVGGVTAGAFACLYRVFSASTMFVPPVVEFSVSREISNLKKSTHFAHRRIFARLFLTSVALVSPIIVIPPEHLHSFFSLAIDLAKFQIIPSDFNLLKIALLLYCFDFCGQRTAYVLDRRRLLISGSLVGLLTCALLIGLILAGTLLVTTQAWFYPLFAYQATTASLILLALLRPKPAARAI